MNWKQMRDNTVAMMTPDWEALKLTAYIVFGVFVPVTALLYVFASLIF